MTKIRRMLVAALLLLSTGEAALGGGLDAIRNRPVDPWISELAQHHVAATRAWAREDYEVWLIRKVQNHIEIWVIDLRGSEATADGSATTGSRESFSLHIDAASQQIVRELAFQ